MDGIRHGLHGALRLAEQRAPYAEERLPVLALTYRRVADTGEWLKAAVRKAHVTVVYALQTRQWLVHYVTVDNGYCAALGEE